MTLRKPLRLGVLLAAAGFSAAASAAREGSLEYRVERIEALVQSQSLIELLTQVQQLQREVRQLRGEVEVQGYQLQQLQGQQRVGGEVSGTLEPFPGAAVELESPPVTPAADDIPGLHAPAPAVAQQSGASREEQAAYDQALNILRAGRYAEAAQAYRTFLADHPHGHYADNARYWLAETQYVTRQFPQALEEFQKLLDDHPASTKLPDALLKIGYIHYEQGDWKTAREQLQAVVQRFPDSTAARLANERLQRMSREGR
ncbi:MAG: tol-pal system protein YbgF [Gammaproteobacteria bacterium]